MIDAIRQRVEQLLGLGDGDQQADKAQAIRLATAALLAEVAQADGRLEAGERDSLRAALSARFSLSDEECVLVMQQGVDAAAEAVSLQGFTRTLHENLSADEKADIIALLWQIAAADGELDKHEDARIAQIGELLYVPRSEVLRLKHAAGF